MHFNYSFLEKMALPLLTKSFIILMDEHVSPDNQAPVAVGRAEFPRRTCSDYYPMGGTPQLLLLFPSLRPCPPQPEQDTLCHHVAYADQGGPCSQKESGHARKQNCHSSGPWHETGTQKRDSGVNQLGACEQTCPGQNHRTGPLFRKVGEPGGSGAFTPQRGTNPMTLF